MRVFVIDDSSFYRDLVAEIAGEARRVEVVGTAAGCDDAMTKLAAEPADLVFCDVMMPGKDGLETLAEIQQHHPDTLVVMISGVNTRSTESTVRALQMGAFEFVRKPDSGSTEENRERLTRDITGALRLAAIHHNTRSAMQAVSGVRHERPPKKARVSKLSSAPYEVAVVGSSTGGPEALGQIIPALPADFPLPILVVQHMPPPFTRALAESLGRRSSLQVTEAADGDLVEPGHVYVAPGGLHMIVREERGEVRVRTRDSAPVHNCKPSVDVLFESAARVYAGSGVIAVVLTGMGEDGKDGVEALKNGACCCIAQERASCVVYGMPRAVSEAGLADLKLPAEQIAGVLTELAGSVAAEAEAER